MSDLLRVARTPSPSVRLLATVQEAVDLMARDRVGAVAVVDEGRLIGIFTERDLMFKVVHQRLDPPATAVGAVCTRSPVTVTRTTPREEALKLMVDRHIRHLPIVDEQDQLVGMLSVRHLLQLEVEQLLHDLDSMAAYMGADGPGG